MMFLREFVGPFHHLITEFTFYDCCTNRSFLAHSRFVPVATLLAFEKAIAIFTKHPSGNGAVLCITQLTGITAEMVFDFIMAFLTRVAVFVTSEECGHACNYIIMIIVGVEVNSLRRLRTRIN